MATLLSARAFASLQLHPHRFLKRSELWFFFVQNGTGTGFGVVDVSRRAIEFIEGHGTQVNDLSVLVAPNHSFGCLLHQVAFPWLLLMPVAAENRSTLGEALRCGQRRELKPALRLPPSAGSPAEDLESTPHLSTSHRCGDRGAPQRTKSSAAQ